MLLRRFIENVNEQNWAAIALDFVVVVLGIFLGLQVSLWNENRQNHEEGLYHLNTLASFLEKDIAKREEEIATVSSHNSNTFGSWNILLDDSIDESDMGDFRLKHFGAFYLWGPKAKPAPLSRIINGGKLDLINSRDIQEAILTFDSVYADKIYQTETSYRTSNDITLIIMMEIKYYEGGIASSMSELKANEKLKSAIRGKAIIQRIQLDTLKEIQKASKTMLDTLTSYLAHQEA